MTDLKSPTLIKAKGLLFLLTGCLAAVLLLLEHPSLKVLILLALTVWCFCRFYYFAFYVIEHYVDPTYRFAGLWDFARYVTRRTSR
jgi:hypothetical protein